MIDSVDPGRGMSCFGASLIEVREGDGRCFGWADASLSPCVMATV
jgi:hypothetical protein